MRVRFDDSLRTVLAADTSTAFGARAAYRQLVDLVGRGRVPADGPILARLETLRPDVPVDTRAAVARGLALVDPPVALVRFLADDVPDVATATLRGVQLSPEGWEALVPHLGPLGRSVLRRRSDLPPSAERALESFGSTDFALGYEAPPAVADAPATPTLTPAPTPTPFQPVGDIAAAVVARARTEKAEPERFEIADLVNRIAAYQRDRHAPAADTPAKPAEAVAAFRFETDASGTIRWIDSAPRGAVVGITLDHAAVAMPCVDGIAAGAFRKRAAFADARLKVAGASPLGGDWRISGVPVFDAARGHFTGYRGAARRPRVEEDAVRARPRDRAPQVEGLRRLVHELRTPTNAIAGFSELIEQELLGPVMPDYRERAATIRRHVGGLIGAIDDLDTAARIESAALELREETVGAAALLGRVAAELAPFAARRGVAIDLRVPDDRSWCVDAPAAERLVSRLLASMVAVAGPDERLSVTAAAGVGKLAAVSITLPAALAGRAEADLLGMDDEQAGLDEGAPLLGIGFALRLARHLATELGGRLSFASDRLTLALPAASTGEMETACTLAP